MNLRGVIDRKTLLHAFWFVPLALLILTTPTLAKTKPIGFAVPFPEVMFEQRLSEEEKAYLGVSGKPDFFFREIHGSLVLVEFASSYCFNCQKQAPILNEVYRKIEKDPQLKQKVKMVGVAAGNTLREVAHFKEEYHILYPILADPRFDVHMAVGSPRVPFLLWVRRNAQGKWLVVSTHLGLIDSAQKILNEMRAVLQYDLALLAPKKGRIYEGAALNPPLSDGELMEKAKEGMEASGGKVFEIKKILLKDGDPIYIGRIDFGTHQGTLFSKLASRRAICDMCHDTFFIYTFDPDGRVVEITPIQLTKIDNLSWSKEDIKKVKRRIIGKSILGPFPFDPHVDAVSGATVTAVLIFDSLDRAKEIYEKLKKEGYLPQ